MTPKLPRAILRACIFCGGEPTKKNREHVLAQWLLELTGDPNRKVGVTFSWEKRETLQFAFDAYVAPACTACNDRYSELENGGRAAVLRMLEHGSLSGAQVTTLLSWLDKIRIGIWRLNNVLAAGALAVDPTFGIDDRIDRSDRAVAICRLNTNKPGLTVVGTSTPLFYFMPSCFGLCINGLALLNISMTGLFGRRAGFPWLERRHNIESGIDQFMAHAGDDVLSPPLISLAAVDEFVRVGNQPMLCQWALKGVTFEKTMYTDWVNSHTLRDGLGRPILGVGGEVRHLLDDDLVTVVGDSVEGGRFFRAVLESQIELARPQTLADGTLRPSLVAACALTQKFVDSLE